MRCFISLACCGLLALVPSFGCDSDGSPGNGTGGVAGAGGAGGMAGIGGMGGMGGSGERVCSIPSQCDDGEPCSQEFCVDRVCRYEPLPDDTVCVSDTGLSLCRTGECQLIWPSCTDPGAEEGDFCQPAENMTRLGRCASGSCEVLPCEIAFDCWDGDLCTDDVCDPSSGECTHPNAPDGTRCDPVTELKQCLDGQCVIPDAP